MSDSEPETVTVSFSASFDILLGSSHLFSFEEEANFVFRLPVAIQLLVPRHFALLWGLGNIRGRTKQRFGFDCYDTLSAVLIVLVVVNGRGFRPQKPTPLCVFPL